MENKSVVLASTAIQLKDDRKSPIVAGKPESMPKINSIDFK